MSDLDKGENSDAGLADILMSSGFDCLSRGEKKEALEIFLRCVGVYPRHFDALHLAGVLTAEQGDLEGASVLLEKAKESGSSAYFYNNYGNVLLQLGRLASAKQAFDTALGLLPNYPEAWSNKANLLLQQEDYAGALKLYGEALAMRPDFADAWANRAVALRCLKQLLAAQQDFEKSLLLNPYSPQYYCAYAELCIELREYGRARELIESALRLDACFGPAHFSLGQLQTTLDKYAEAKQSYESALRFRGAVAADIYERLIVCSYNLLDVQGVEKYLARRFAIANDFKARWLSLMTRVPIAPESIIEAKKTRRIFLTELMQLDDWLSKNGVADYWKYIGQGLTNFYSTYHHLDDKNLLEKYGRVCRMLMAPLQEKLTLKKNVCSQAIRIGVVSGHIRDHAIWRDKIKGLYLFKPDEFEIYTFVFGLEGGVEKALAKENSSKYYSVSHNFSEAVQKIQESELDVIYFPEVGIVSEVYKLACLRLAPIQVASWGNPLTTGLSSIDYFVSSHFFESNESEGCYSEDIIYLNAFPTYYEEYSGGIKEFSCENNQIDLTKKIILAAGTAFKYQFDFAKIYADIAESLDNVQIVFFEYDSVIFEKVKSKLVAEFDARKISRAKLVFIPWLAREEYQFLMSKSYLLLDSLEFSGINTVLQALDVGLPVVTHRGQFLRGRLGSGVLDAVGMGAWVAATEKEYVEWVCRLVLDSDLHIRYQEDLAAVRERMFGNRACVDEFYGAIRKLCKRTFA